MIIYLPGNSPLNRNELELFSNLFLEKGIKHYSHEYEHWNDESKSFELQNEINRIKEAIKEHDFSEYGIVAKSIGTWAAVNLLKEMGEKTPKFVVLMGIPSEISANNIDTFKNNLKDSKAKVFSVNNEKDPYVNLKTVGEILSEIDNRMVTVPNNDTHQYQNTDEVWDMIKDYV